MSIKVSNLVRSRRFGSPARKAIALKLADVAKDDGSSIFPSAETIARETEFCERLVRAVLAELRAGGILIVVAAGGGRMKATRYKMDLEAVALLPEVNPAPRAPFNSETLHHVPLNPAPRAPEPSGTIITPTETPPGGGAIAPSVSKMIWSEGLTLLSPCLPEGRYHSLIGKWCKRAREADQMEQLLSILRAATQAGTLDPVPYVEKALNIAIPPPPDPKTLSNDEWTYRIQTAIARKSWLPEWGPKPGERNCIVPSELVTPQLLHAVDHSGRRHAA